MKPIKFSLIFFLMLGLISMAFINTLVIRKGNDEGEISRFYGAYIAESKIKDAIPPQFPGGEHKLFCFIEDNFVFSDTAIDYKVYGNIGLSFTVSTKGKIENIKFEEKSPNTLIFKRVGFFDELERVLSLSPKWKPAKHKGKNIPFEIKLRVILDPNFDDDFEDEYEIMAPPPPPMPIIDEKTDRIFINVQYMPSYPGGQDSLLAFIDKHFTYPDDAKKNNIEGRVLISFIVNKDGTLTDIKPLMPEERRLGYGLEEEGVRVVSLMPDWIPGKQRHIAVPVRYTLPIRCQIKN